MDDLKLRLDELTENPTARVPVSLVLDVSASMHEDNRIGELNTAVSMFFDAIRRDEMAAIAAEIQVIAFNDEATRLIEFASIDRQRVPQLRASGMTAMGAAMMLAMDELEQAKRTYSKIGVEYFQPWLVLMTDGQPTDNIEAAVQRCQVLVRERKLTVFPIAIGAGANLATLSRFSPTMEPLRIHAVDLSRFFKWLSMSVSKQAQSRSVPGDRQSAALGEQEFARARMDLNAAILGR